MTYYIKKMALHYFLAITMAVSCTETKTTKEEEIKIKTMDSTSKAVEASKEKLEEQTKKVEASLEKLDKEFEASK